MVLNQKEKSKLRTWVEIDKGAIRKNYQTFKKLVTPGTILMAVVKSNAFGHDLVLFSKEVVKLGASFLGVDSFQEAKALRAAGVKVRILVFGYTSPEFYKEAAAKNISLTVSSFENLNALANIKVGKVKIHLKADTGLGRQGFGMKEMPKVLDFFKNKKNIASLELEGLYSHLAVGEDLAGREYTMKQADKLGQWHEKFNMIGFKPLKHICATSSAMFFPELHFDMVRVGLGMYGLWPSKESQKVLHNKYTLYPVLSWKTIVTEAKKLPRGLKVGYDLTEELKKDSLVGIIPVGYWHGYPRLLSSRGMLSVNGKKVKVLGRVSMDMTILDLTGSGAKPGDEVLIIGAGVPAESLAEGANTINYEVVTRINPEIPRFLIK